MVPPGAMAFARTMGAAETEELVTLEALEAGWRGLSVCDLDWTNWDHSISLLMFLVQYN